MTMAERTIGPTKERLAHAGRDVEAFSPDENVNWRTIRMLDNAPLESLVTRGVITGDQYHAGMRFYGDWYYSGLSSLGVLDPGRIIVDTSPVYEQTENKLDSATRWRRAVQGVGLIHSHVLTSVLLNGERMETYGERAFKLADKKDARLAARVSLINALDALDMFYYGHRNERTQKAHRPDYRPAIQTLDKPTPRE